MATWATLVFFVSDACFGKMTMLFGRTAAQRAHVRSHSGRNAGTRPLPNDTRIHHSTSLLQHTVLQITEATCEGCQAPLDTFVVRETERMTARVFHKAGACVRMRFSGCAVPSVAMATPTHTQLTTTVLSWCRRVGRRRCRVQNLLLQAVARSLFSPSEQVEDGASRPCR